MGSFEDKKGGGSGRKYSLSFDWPKEGWSAAKVRRESD